MAALITIDLSGGDYAWYVITEDGWTRVMAWDGESTDYESFYVHVAAVVGDKNYVLTEGACQEGVPTTLAGRPDLDGHRINHLLYVR